MRGAWVGVGANLGDRRRTVARALDRLAGLRGIEVVRCSRLRETAPVGGPPGQPPYLNGAFELRTARSPLGLLDALLETEAALGRVRLVRFGPRTLDLDLLLFEDRTLEGPRLTVPHPHMAQRAFVLEPLAELCPDRAVPLPRRAPCPTVIELLDALRYPATMPACAGATPPPS